LTPASGRTRLYDFFTQAPRTSNPAACAYPLEADFGSTRQVFHLGAASMAAPGCVAGLLRIHDDLGRLPRAECAAPARELCRNGVRITDHAASLLDVVSTLYLSSSESRRLFQSVTSPDRCLRDGETFRNPDFEGFLDMLVAEGERWFYEGDVARLVDAFSRDQEGHLRREDFSSYEVFLREPLRIQRHGGRIHLNPPPSMGGTLIAVALALNTPLEAHAYPFAQASDWKSWIEPLRLMSLLRSEDGIARLTRTEQASLGEALESNPEIRKAALILFPEALCQVRSEGTTQLSIMDHHGNEISLTTSNGAGSGVIVPGTGFMMNNMLGEEDLQPGGLGSWKPGRRLASMMAPLLAELADGSRVATGSGGSNRIRSTLLQILRHLLERRASIEEAVTAPRLHWEDSQLHAEQAAATALREIKGFAPVEHSIPNLFFGGAHTVCRLPDGTLRGLGDPRRGGVSLLVK
ncbi:MAG: gamma-glutamyltransferase, partial [Oceanipulchritudo sp.]